MKEFKKNQENLFVCEECEKIYVKKENLSRHIRLIHNGQKQYYDKWLKENDEGSCKICSKETEFTGFKKQYKNCCSDKCSYKYTQQEVEKSLLLKYNVKNHFQRKEVQEKSKQTKLEKYENENYNNPEKNKETNLKNHNGIHSASTKECIEKVKQTKLKKYDDENFNNREKAKQTNLERYGSISYTGTSAYKESILNNFGVENVFQLDSVKEKCKLTHLENLGVENPGQSEICKEKSKQTCFEHFGVECSFQAEEVKKKSKQTKKDRYGDENYNNREKSKQTCLEHFGIEYSFQSEEVREKAKQTCLKHFGVEHQLQNKEIFEKQQKTARKLKYYKDTSIYYRGLYEFDFLDKHHDKYPDIINAKSINYIFNNEKHVYHPDFFIPSLNLIVEIKNSYLAKKDKDKIEAKKEATIANGFKYIMIIDKDYIEFDNLLLSLNGETI